MKEKEEYTLKELFDALEITISALARKGSMNEGTASRIRDGFPARRSTLNKLLRAFSEVYGLPFSFENVTGLQIEDKHATDKGKSPSAPTITIDDKAQPEKTPNRIVEPKRPYTKQKEKKSTLPEGCILASEFALAHGVARPTFIDHMNNGLGPGLIGTSTNTIPERDRVDYDKREKRTRKDGTIEYERYLTQEQQKAALHFWKRQDVVYTLCDQVACPCQKGELN